MKRKMRLSIGVATCYNTETKQVEGYDFVSDPIPQIDFKECDLLVEKQVGAEIRFSQDFGSYIESKQPFLHIATCTTFPFPSCFYE